ncbi:MAG TPA: glycosyltransferase [Acidobacteriota bacterium]
MRAEPGMEPRAVPDWRGKTILLVLRTLAMGGTERQVGYLAPWLRKETGARTVVWALERGGPLAARLESRGVEWELQRGILEHRGAAKLGALLALLRRLRRLGPDAILSFNDLPNKVCGALWPWSKAGICVWNQRDEGREVTGRFLERRALRQVRVFTANSAQGVEFLTGKFGVAAERITLIPNSVRLDPPGRTRDEWRAGMGIGPRAVLAAMIANLHHFKDHETLLRAWALATAASGGDAPHLALAGGPGDTFPMLLDLSRSLALEKSVHFIGPTDDISGLLAASDIGVFSSRLEGMPNGVLECMAAGLPVVATRIAGITAALGGDYPLLVPPADVMALADGLRALIGDERLRRRLGERNQCRARDEFSPSAMGMRFVSILEPFLSRPFGKGN